MTETMAAAVFDGETLGVEKVAQPTPGPGEVRVAVAACGFCHTDLHYLDHGVPTAKEPPVTLGHETSGTVDALGDDVDGWTVGDPVLLPAVLPCGGCDLCRRGRSNICRRMEMFGNHRDGGFAEHVLAPAKDLIPLPEELDLATASIIADALSTPYHAIVNRARVRPGEWVAVVGCGGVGINVVQLAKAVGARVVAVDLRDEALAVAEALGAAETVNPEEDDVEEAIEGITDGGADVAVEAVGTPETIETALSLVRRGGRTVLVGYSGESAALPARRVMFHEQSIVGSLGCRPADYPRIVDLVRRGAVELDPVVTDRVPLDRIGEAADALREGRGLRTIVEPGGPR